jgi:hypothetical protein
MLSGHKFRRIAAFAILPMARSSFAKLFATSRLYFHLSLKSNINSLRQPVLAKLNIYAILFMFMVFM